MMLEVRSTADAMYKKCPICPSGWLVRRLLDLSEGTAQPPAPYLAGIHCFECDRCGESASASLHYAQALAVATHMTEASGSAAAGNLGRCYIDLSERVDGLQARLSASEANVSTMLALLRSLLPLLADKWEWEARDKIMATIAKVETDARR